MEQIVKKLDLYKTLETREIGLTQSGSDVYGTSTSDSDIDLRGYWIQKKEYTYGVIGQNDTFEKTFELHGFKYDIVMYEIGKFCSLFNKSNPSTIEWVFNTVSWRYPTIVPEFIRKLQTVGVVNEQSFYLGLFGWITYYMKHTPNRVKSLLDIMRICLEAEAYHGHHVIVPNIKKALKVVEPDRVSIADYDCLMDLKKQGVKEVKDTDKVFSNIMTYFNEVQSMIKPKEIDMDFSIVQKRKERVNELLIAERDDEYS